MRALFVLCRGEIQALCSALVMKRFDSKALYNALDQKRRDHQMSWSQVSAEIGVSVSTITRTQRGSRMEVDGMLAMVDWLGVSVETFVRESPS